MPRLIADDKQRVGKTVAVDEKGYSQYTPSKVKDGRPHPDIVVENATLAAVLPPDPTYSLKMPTHIINDGKLSNIQLEAVIYGCQRHMSYLSHLDSHGSVSKRGPHTPCYDRERSGFFLGDGAGLGKGRTLAGFVQENVSCGRKRHVWISTNNDLFQGEFYFCKRCDNVFHFVSCLDLKLLWPIDLLRCQARPT